MNLKVAVLLVALQVMSSLASIPSLIAFNGPSSSSEVELVTTCLLHTAAYIT